MEKLSNREFGGILTALMILTGCAGTIPADNKRETFLPRKTATTPCLRALSSTEWAVSFTEGLLASGDVNCPKLEVLSERIRSALLYTTSFCGAKQMHIGGELERRFSNILGNSKKTRDGVLRRCPPERQKNPPVPKGALFASIASN